MTSTLNSSSWEREEDAEQSATQEQGIRCARVKRALLYRGFFIRAIGTYGREDGIGTAGRVPGVRRCYRHSRS